MLEQTPATGGGYSAAHLNLHLHFSTPTSELRCALCQQNTENTDREDEVKDNAAASDPSVHVQAQWKKFPTPHAGVFSEAPN